MINHRETPVVRGEQVEKLLNALADPPEPHDSHAPQTTVPPNTKEVLAQARELRGHLGRVIQVAESLPVERCDFFADSLQPWRSKLKKTKRQRKRARQELQDIVRSTTPGTQQRRLVMEGALASYVLRSGALAFLNVTYRPIKLASVATTLIRIAILTVLVLGGFFLDQTINANGVTWIALALTIVIFAFLDLILVDRLIEPLLEAHRFRTILAECREAIRACQNLEANPQHLAAVLDGVILGED